MLPTFLPYGQTLTKRSAQTLKKEERKVGPEMKGLPWCSSAGCLVVLSGYPLPCFAGSGGHAGGSQKGLEGIAVIAIGNSASVAVFRERRRRRPRSSEEAILYCQAV